MSKSAPDSNFDLRVVDRYIAKGTVKESDYKEHLKNLPDDASNAEYVQMDLMETEIVVDEMEPEDA